ncbi:hypothetical protein BDA96_01G082500 [Sorghum bicolor]|uniref:Uncharacterized protein n=2 Tax=Sorghum bicolor TaxID=4558 RepID=A0A921UXY4_SORBI|nr:hypothetical protein BDA96_01G082500 [Sorghum bicolor]OQU90936.1 hypothetical protein SORBI_3001G079401 [Sorghum bicolor]
MCMWCGKTDLGSGAGRLRLRRCGCEMRSSLVGCGCMHISTDPRIPGVTRPGRSQASVRFGAQHGSAPPASLISVRASRGVGGRRARCIRGPWGNWASDTSP